MSSIFDDFAPRRSTDDETQPFARPSREYLEGFGGPSLREPAPAASFDDAPFGGRYDAGRFEADAPVNPVAGDRPEGTTALLGEMPYVHTAPRTTSPMARRVLVGAGSLAVGALAAGGAAFAIGGGGEEPAVALSNKLAAPSQTAQAPIDDSTRTQDVSRSDVRPGMCVKLDATAIAAIDKARAGAANAKADGRSVTIKLADGDVTVPLSAVKVVKCSVPAAAAPAAASTSAAQAASSKAKASSSTTAPKAATTTKAKTTSAPKSSTTTAPKASTTKPRTTTSTTPKATTTTPKSTKTSGS